MKKIIFLLAAMLFCQPAVAVELLDSNFSVDSYRFYFGLHITGLPPDAASINLYTAGFCPILPVSYEQFSVTVSSDGVSVLDGPEVTTNGSPALDRWLDGPTDHLSLVSIEFGNITVNGSIINGAQQFQPGDTLCMRIDVPGSSHAYSGLVITETPEASVHVQKLSTTRLASQAGQVIPYSYRIENTGSVFIHDVSVEDDNVDEPPVCAFESNDELAPEGQPRSVVFCTAEHTVTQAEIDANKGVSNTATVTADELDGVTASLHIPTGILRDGFESPPNTISLLTGSSQNYGIQHDIAVGADGIPVIAFFEPVTENLKVAKCLDLQCTAASFSVVHGSENVVGHFPSIAIGHDELPVIAYHDATDGALLVAKCNDDACSGGDEQISVVDDGGAGRDISLAIGDDGMPVISYGSQVNGKLRVAHCNDAACSGDDETISELNDEESQSSLNTSIAIGDDGYPVISYQKLVSPWDGILKVAKCNDASCSGADETITTLDTTGGPTFESTSIAVGPDGNPVIAYLDIVADAITVAKCNDPACSGGDETFTAIHSTNTYMKLSLALPPDGKPVISYLGSLAVTRCNDPACAGADESAAIVDETAVARSSAMAIGADGLPVISYVDQVTGALWVAHCGSLSCD